LSFELGWVGFLDFTGFLPYWIFFFKIFKKNEEVISSVHLMTYLVKFGGGLYQFSPPSAKKKVSLRGGTTKQSVIFSKMSFAQFIDYFHLF
jgi:hypothetical protein